MFLQIDFQNMSFLPDFKIGRAVAALLLMSVVVAQHWDQMSNLPFIGHNNPMAYDATSGRVMLFGTSAQNATWLYDGVSWQQANVTGPSVRYAHRMVQDPARNRIVLFGGLIGGSGSGVLGDTWEWDGAQWTPKISANYPSARSGHAMTWDANLGKVLLFGGSNLTGLLNDTWAWDGVNWIQHFPANPPAPRWGAAAAYCVASSRVVLFGGGSAAGLTSEFYQWDGVDWGQVTSVVGPPARSGSWLTKCNRPGSLVMFGGYGGSGPGQLTDTWEWDGATWTSIAPVASPIPDPASAGTACYDEIRNQTLVVLNIYEQWRYRVPLAAASAFGQGCAGVAALAPSQGDRPLIGQDFNFDVASMPTATVAAFVAIGFSSQALGPFILPLPLDGLGMPGCLLHHDAALVSSMQVQGSTSHGSLTLPPSFSLEGHHLYLQGLLLAPGVNSLGFVMTNALDLVLGNH